MVETLEAPVQESPVVEYETLDEILPAVQRLTAHDKLVLIRILADELAHENGNSEQDSLLKLLPPNTVIEIYSPIEVTGNLEHFESLLNSTSNNET